MNFELTNILSSCSEMCTGHLKVEMGLNGSTTLTKM